jgi:hypothetical protein
MKNINKKIHRKVFINYISNVDDELTTENMDFDMIWKLDNLFFSDGGFRKNNNLKLVNFQMKQKLYDEKHK